MATCCSTLNGGITIDCSPNTAGVVRLWLANKCNVTLTKGTVGEEEEPSTEGMITAITMAASTYFYEFEGLPNSISMDEAATISTENGTSYYVPSVKIRIPKREVAKRNKLRLLANQRMVLVVEDRNGIFWLLGSQDGMTLNELTGGLGENIDGFNGYALGFTGQEADMAFTIDWTIFEPVIAP